MIEKIIIDHYEGAYGKTIKVAVSNTQTLIFIKELLDTLSENNDSELEMSNLEGVEVIGIKSLLLKRVSTEPGLGGHLKMVDEDSFIWARSKEGWKQCAELIDGLIISGIASHQYLTSEEYDDALVIISLQ